MPKPNNSTTGNIGFEAQLWAAADALRSNMDAAEVEDDGEPFDEKMTRLVAQIGEHTRQARTLDAAIARNLQELGYALPE